MLSLKKDIKLYLQYGLKYVNIKTRKKPRQHKQMSTIILSDRLISGSLFKYFFLISQEFYKEHISFTKWKPLNYIYFL